MKIVATCGWWVICKQDGLGKLQCNMMESKVHVKNVEFSSWGSDALKLQWKRLVWSGFLPKKLCTLREGLSINALHACVYIYIEAALLGRPHCGLSTWLLLLAIFNTLFWVYDNSFHEEMHKTWKYSKSAISIWYEMAADGYWARKALILRASLIEVNI